MKKIGSLLVLLFILSGCHFPKYTFDMESSRYGVDFNNGEWLLNYVDGPAAVNDKLTEMAVEEFSSYLGYSLHYAWKENGLIIPKGLVSNYTEEQLTDLKVGTNFDFFISIRGKIDSDDMGSLQIGDVDHGEKKVNQGWIYLEIYDLNLKERIYFQKVTGIITAEDEHRDFVISKSAGDMIVGGMKRIFKKIKNTHTPIKD